MEPIRYDFIVIGTGPAGLSAAMTIAKAGKKVLTIEKEDSLGGVCVNTGTMPSKTLREAVLHLTGHFKRKVFSSECDEICDSVFSMNQLKDRLHHVRREEHQIINCQLERNGVDIIRGIARFIDETTLLIDQATSQKQITVKAERIIVATGSQPRNPPEIPFDHTTIVDSTSILTLQRIPCSLIILGGGVIGSEYATIFAALNVKVTLLDPGDTPLKFLDHEIIDQMMENYPWNTIELVRKCGQFKIEKNTNSVSVHLATGQSYSAECLLFALGREANVNGLSIEHAGIITNSYHYIEVNELYQTSQPNIYAVGDVIGWPSLAATSIIQGRLAALNGLHKRIESFPRIFPFGIYTIPEISYIGITEQEAEAAEFSYVVGRCYYHELPRGQISGDCEGMLKMVVHRDTREILGVHIIGSCATEIIHIAQIALIQNAKIDLFIDNIFNYPTYSEAMKIASLSALNKINKVSPKEEQCSLARKG